MARALYLIGLSMPVMSLAGARDAAAIGVCENTPRRYEPPRLFSEKEQAFAVPGTQAWCEERAGGGEVRGEIAFVELRGVDGGVVGHLASARGKDAERLERLVGAFEAVAKDKLAAALKARGYAPLAAATAGGKLRCEVRAALTGAPKETVNGFPAEQAHLDVVGGGKRIARVEVGLIAKQRRGELVLRAQVLAKRAAIAVWVRAPSCAGPPPGYFGPDDPGDCYAEEEIESLVLEAAKLPALAACFAAATP